MCAQAFAELPRERLVALSVFCRAESVPAGSVLATQDDTASHMFLILEGTVAHILEGEDTGNPLAPAPKQAADSVLGAEFVSAGSAAGMRAALDRRASALGSKASTARCGCHCDQPVLRILAADEEWLHSPCRVSCQLHAMICAPREPVLCHECGLC